MLHPEHARGDASGKNVGASLGGPEALERLLTICVGACELARAHPANAIFGRSRKLFFQNRHPRAVARL